MARRQQRPSARNVTAFKADSDFLGAQDIMGRGDVPLRVVDVVTYPASHKVGGRPYGTDFPVMVYEVRAGNDWRVGRKRWMLTSVEVRRSLMIRFESVHVADWRTGVIAVWPDVVPSPKGGWTWGIRLRLTPDELNDGTRREKMRRAAARLPPEERESEPGHPGPPDPPEVQQEPHDDTEPPDTWEPGDGPDKESTNGHADMDT